MVLLLPARLNAVVVGVLVTCVLIYTILRTHSIEHQDELPPEEIILHNQDSSNRGVHITRPAMDKTLDHVKNGTLGFQNVYMISLPTRTDKQDSFAMQAALSGILYTQLDGIDGSLVPPKALPHTMDQNANTIGCWRAHMNALRQIVHENVQTAVIFEDDADWDVAFKLQLVQFAKGSRYILNSSATEPPMSPYGNDWDILWIGHCGTWFHEEDNRRVFVIPNDHTVEPPQFRKNVDMPDMKHWEGGSSGDNSTRIIFNSKGGVCTAAYAVSQRGARKALYHMSMVPFNSPVDWGYAGLCANKEIDFICVSVFPQLVGVARPTAHTSKWSDIGYGNDNDRTVEEANSQHIVYSTRLNMEKLLKGDTVFDSQYPDLRPALDLRDIGGAVGHIEVLSEGIGPKPGTKDEAAAI